MKDKLSLKVSELEHLKSDAISRVLPLGEAISGGGEGSSLISSAIVEPLDLLKKNMRRDTSSAIAKSDVISAVDKPKLDFSKFLRKKTEIPEYAIKIKHEPHPQISMGGMEAIPAMAIYKMTTMQDRKSKLTQAIDKIITQNIEEADCNIHATKAINKLLIQE
ncbi:300_t:CDS:2, partial [Entrophospora sp. SA101]